MKYFQGNSLSYLFTEGDSSYGAPGKGIKTDKTTTNPNSPTILKDKPHKVNTEHSKEIKKPDELDNWISQLENDIDDSKVKRPKEKEMKEQNDRKNEDYYDEEYDQFHDETQDIYPDHNGGQSVKQEENNKKEKDQSNEHINEKHNDFDYGKLFLSLTRTNVASVGSVFNDTRKVKVLSLTT